MALAVWLRHRRSEDLDFFVPELLDSAALVPALSDTDRKQLRDFIDVMCIERGGDITVEQGVILYCRKHGIRFDLDNVRAFLGHLTDFRHLDDDPAMHDTFGVDARSVVMAYFQRRSPEVAASFSPLFVEEAQPPAAGVDV